MQNRRRVNWRQRSCLEYQMQELPDVFPEEEDWDEEWYEEPEEPDD